MEHYKHHNESIRILTEDVNAGNVISLLLKYPQSGVMINRIFMSTKEEGARQGGSLPSM